MRDNRSMSGLKTTLLMASLATLFIFIGGALGGQSGIIMAFIFAVGVNGISYWFSDRIVLKMHKASEVGEEHVLFRVTRRLGALCLVGGLALFVIFLMTI